MPIQIVTHYHFITDDGTAYSDTVNEVIDQDEDATFPIRDQFPIGIVREQFYDFSVAEAFAQGMDAQFNTLMIINRDDSNTCTLFIEGFGAKEYAVTLGPGEWHYLPTSMMAAGTGSAPPLDVIQTLYAQFANAAGTIEMLAFQNPGS